MSKRKVFLVEDDPLMIRMYERALKFSGFEVELAITGKEAMKKLEAMKEKPPIVLLDIMMPEIDGFEVLRRMKNNPSLKNIPVIVLTNLSVGEETGVRALELGANLYLVKSQHTSQEVVERVKEVLAGGTKTSKKVQLSKTKKGKK